MNFWQTFVLFGIETVAIHLCNICKNFELFVNFTEIIGNNICSKHRKNDKVELDKNDFLTLVYILKYNDNILKVFVEYKFEHSIISCNGDPNCFFLDMAIRLSLDIREERHIKIVMVTRLNSPISGP